MINPWKGRRTRRDATLRAEIRRLQMLLEHSLAERERLIVEKGDERERRKDAELHAAATAGLLAARQTELAAARARYDHVWGQVKTRPPVPYPARVTVVNAGIPAVLPVTAVKPRMDVPRWVPTAETVAETTQPIPLAQRERQTSWGARKQDAEATEELPVLDRPA